MESQLQQQPTVGQLKAELCHYLCFFEGGIPLLNAYTDALTASLMTPQ
jgi:hypothetical protein